VFALVNCDKKRSISTLNNRPNRECFPAADIEPRVHLIENNCNAKAMKTVRRASLSTNAQRWNRKRVISIGE
jgi:hypothetical protein